MKKCYRLQPQNATRVRHLGAGVRLAAPPGAAGTTAGSPRQRPRRTAPKRAAACTTGRRCGTIGTDPDREQTMRKNPLATAIRAIVSPEFETFCDPLHPGLLLVARRGADGRPDAKKIVAAIEQRETLDVLNPIFRDPATRRPGPTRWHRCPARRGVVEVDVQDIGPSVQQAQPVAAGQLPCRLCGAGHTRVLAVQRGANPKQPSPGRRPAGGRSVPTHPHRHSA